MNLEDVLKRYDCRLSVSGNRWLTWYQDLWTVFEHKSYAKKTRVLIQTVNLQQALDVLVEGEEPDSQ